MPKPTPSTPPPAAEQSPFLSEDATFKILVVADAANPDRYLADILKAAGYQALIAGHDRAVAILTEEDPAVALIDLTKDTELGLETVRKVHMCAPGTACIVLKNQQSHRAAIQAIGLGAYLYLAKPLDAEQLLLLVRRAVEQRETAETRGETDERCRVFVDNIKLPVSLFDRHGVFLSANLTAAQRLGSTPDAIIGKSLLDLRPDIAEAHIALIRQVMDSGTAMEYHPENATPKNGQAGLITLHPIRNAKAFITAVQVVEYAFTER